MGLWSTPIASFKTPLGRATGSTPSMVLWAVAPPKIPSTPLLRQFQGWTYLKKVRSSQLVKSPNPFTCEQHLPNQRISQWFRHHEIHVAPASMAPHVSIICPSFQVTNSAHDVNRIHRLSDPVPHRVAFVSMAMFLPFSTNGLENLKQTKNRLRRQRNNGVAIDLNQLQKQANPKDQKMKHTTQGVALTNLKEKMT